MKTELTPMCSTKLNEARSHMLGALENHLYDEVRFYADQVANVSEDDREELVDCLLLDLNNLHMYYDNV